MILAILLFVSVLHLAESASAADDMGPAAFMWPADRVWSAAADNTGPCGSVAAVGNRTEFPMQNGKIAVVAQDESWDMELSISYLDNPESNSDFKAIIDAKSMRELDPGHTCVNVVDAPSSVKAGSNATFQIKYIADFDTPDNQTFYACADITYVELTNFNTPIPCFNTTYPEDGDSGSDSDHKPGSGSGSDDKGSDKPSSGGSSGLSGGAIAGIVVGCVVGFGVIAVAAILFYRRRHQRLNVLRQQRSSRGVDWDNQPKVAKDSISNSSVRMQNLSTS